MSTLRRESVDEPGSDHGIVGKGRAAVRMRITLDGTEPPEFETFASILVAVRGAHWSISNSELGSEVPLDQLAALLAAIQQMENILVPLSAEERDGSFPVMAKAARYSMVERVEVVSATRDDEVVARIIVHDHPEPGEDRQIDLTVPGAMQAAIQLLQFVQQVGSPGLFPTA